MALTKISGKVVKGLGYGRKLGYPTANIERRGWARLKKKPKLGVWAGRAELKVENFPLSSRLQGTGKLKASPSPLIPPPRGGRVGWGWYKAGIVVGPLDKNSLPKIEAHLIGFKGNLYGKKITIVLEKYLRPFKKYKSEIELKEQIKKDIKMVRGSIKN